MSFQTATIFRMFEVVSDVSEPGLKLYQHHGCESGWRGVWNRKSHSFSHYYFFFSTLFFLWLSCWLRSAGRAAVLASSRRLGTVPGQRQRCQGHRRQPVPNPLQKLVSLSFHSRIRSNQLFFLILFPSFNSCRIGSPPIHSVHRHRC